MTMEKVFARLDALESRYPQLAVCRNDILSAYETLAECYKKGCKLLLAGNGGSYADAQHIAGELMKSFKLSRRCPEEFSDKLLRYGGERGAALSEKLQCGLPAIVLGEHQALNTAFVNDVAEGGEFVFAQQTFVFGKKGDVFMGISTSGNSRNVMNAACVARAAGLKVIALTGARGGELAGFADIAIKVPADETYMIQELHLPVYHCLCLMLEEAFYG